MRRVNSLEKTLLLAGIGPGGEGDDRGWDGWMASLTWWTWVWVNSGSWWWTVRPGVLRFMVLQRVRHDWVTELNYYNALTWFSMDIVTLGMDVGIFHLCHWLNVKGNLSLMWNNLTNLLQMRRWLWYSKMHQLDPLPWRTYCSATEKALSRQSSTIKSSSVWLCYRFNLRLNAFRRAIHGQWLSRRVYMKAWPS